jgi:hypothetical protein
MQHEADALSLHLLKFSKTLDKSPGSAHVSSSKIFRHTKTEKHVLWIIIKTISDFKNQLYVRELLSKDNSHKKRTTYKAMSSGKITVGARKTATRIRAIKNKNPLRKRTL